MGIYFGGFGVSRRGLRFRPYLGIARGIIPGIAIGLSGRGTPWLKINARRLLRLPSPPPTAPPSLVDKVCAYLILVFLCMLAISIWGMWPP